MESLEGLELERIKQESILERKRSASERDRYGEKEDEREHGLDAPNKKHCLREIENSRDVDNRRISGVKLRLQHLSALYQSTDENNSDIKLSEDTVTEFEPRACEEMAEVDVPVQRSGARSSRLSVLAQNINNWEDDLKPTSNRTSSVVGQKTQATNVILTTASSKVATITAFDKPILTTADKSSDILSKSSNSSSKLIADSKSLSSQNRETNDTRIRLKSSDDVLQKKSDNMSNKRQDLSSAIMDIAAEWETGKSSKNFGVESRIPSVSERMAGWQKKVDESSSSSAKESSYRIKANPPRRSIMTVEEIKTSSTKPVAGVRSRLSMWEPKGTSEDTVGNSVFEEFRKKPSTIMHKGPEARDSGISGILEENEEQMTDDFVAADDKSSMEAVIEKPRPSSRRSILGLIHKPSHQDPKETTLPDQPTVNLLTYPTTAVRVDSIIEEEPSFEPHTVDSKVKPSESKIMKDNVSCDSTGDDVPKADMETVEEAVDDDHREMDGTLQRGVNDRLSGSTDVSSSGTSDANADLASISSSMIDAEIQRISASASEDDDEQDDGDEDGVFELLDDAIGDSLSCASQHSGKSDKQQPERGMSTFHSTTPPSDGTSISSSDFQSTGSNSVGKRSNISVRTALLNDAFESSDIVRHHKISETAQNEKRKQNMRANSDGFLLDEYGRSDSCDDKRCTYISDIRLGSETEESSKSMEDLSHRSNWYNFDPRASVRSSIRYNPFQKPSCDTRDLSDKSPAEQIKILQELVAQEHNVTVQTSNALNQCCHVNSAFASSPESVECHRLLLVTDKKQETFQKEIARLTKQDKLNNGERVCKALGNLIISDVVLPLKPEFLTKLTHGEDVARHYFVTMLRCGGMTYFSQMMTSSDAVKRGILDVSGIFRFFDLPADFKIELQIFSMAILKEPQTPKKRKGLTPKKLLKTKSPGRLLDKMDSVSGVRSTSFSLLASSVIDISKIRCNVFPLNQEKEISLLDGKIQAKIDCCLSVGLEERGFLTLFEDVNGFGAWHRRWCLLKKDTLYFWKYPDEEKTKDPVSVVDIKQCVTKNVEQIQRDICARPNTFELITVRRQNKDDKDSLVTTCTNNIATTKHWLSADTKEDCQLWCRRFNETLQDLRTWQPDTVPVPK